jgi:hypothetical protein
MASDGKWYPPMWEYNWTTSFHRQTGEAIRAVGDRADELGKQGWEMVSHTVQGMPAQGGFSTEVTAFFRRRIIQ